MNDESFQIAFSNVMASDKLTEYFSKLRESMNLTSESISFMVNQFRVFPDACGEFPQTDFEELSASLPGSHVSVDCPVCDKSPHRELLPDIIIHINDEHHWTREQIADWLETLDIDLEFKDAKSSDTFDTEWQ